jgi:hypothetical protein
VLLRCWEIKARVVEGLLARLGTKEMVRARAISASDQERAAVEGYGAAGTGDWVRNGAAGVGGDQERASGGGCWRAGDESDCALGAAWRWGRSRASARWTGCWRGWGTNGCASAAEALGSQDASGGGPLARL